MQRDKDGYLPSYYGPKHNNVRLAGRILGFHKETSSARSTCSNRISSDASNYSLCIRTKSRRSWLFLDYVGISQTNTNNFGLGGRFGYRVHHNVMLEGEVAYDYGINFDEAYRNVTNGNLAAIERTSIGITHGLVGPMLQPSKGWFRPFVTMKAGVMDFRLSPSLLPYSSIVSTVLGLRTSSTNFALYPGGGVEASVGPVGVRFELGDEVYFNRGGHNNLRITFGPIVRF